MSKKNCEKLAQSVQRLFSLALIVSVSAIALSCTPEPTQNTSPSPQDPQANLNQTLTVAVIPWQSLEAQQKKLQPLSDYLQQTMNRSVEFQITKDYQTAVDLLVEEKVDMAYLAALTYVKARERNPNLEPLVLPIEKSTGRPWYTSVIVADVNQGINSLPDLKGKRFAFVSPSSTSGFLMPMNLFQQENINPSQDFAKVIYPGSHDTTEKALANGEIDAIADDKPSFKRAQTNGTLAGDKYKIIWESNPIPSGPITIDTSKFTPQEIEKLQQALIDAPIGVVDVSGSESAGYTLTKNADFDEIRDIYNRVKSITIPEK